MVAVTLLNRRATRKLTAALRLLTLPDLGPAEAAFQALAKSRLPLVAAQAESQLARLAFRRGQFPEALALVEKGLARVAKNVGAADLLVPALIARRAYILAALDRRDEARAELETLAAAHPSYPWLAGAELLPRALIALREGDFAAATALYAQRTPDLPMELPDELLADTLAAMSDPRPAVEEVERLRGELSEAADLRAWVGSVWPGAERVLDEARARAV